MRLSLSGVLALLAAIVLGVLFYVKSIQPTGARSAPTATANDAMTKELRALSACRLVGVWKALPPESFTKLIDDARGVRAEHDPLKPAPEPAPPFLRAEVFLPDGTWRSAKVGDDSSWHSQWNVALDHGDTVTIVMDDPETPGKQLTRVFVFDSPDRIHEQGGLFDGMKYVRAKDLK